MVVAWGRECEVIIYNPKEPELSPTSYKNFDKTNNNQFRISFNIQFQKGKNKNPATITIWNLSQYTREFWLLEKQLKTTLKIEVYAGYGGVRTRIYKGDIRLISIERQGNDIATIFNCGDGYEAIKNVKVSKSFNEGTNYKTMVSFITGELKKAGTEIANGFQDAFSGKTTFGELFTGKALDNLEAIAKKQGLEINMLNNSLEITKTNTPINKDAVLLNIGSGLIGLPVKKDKGISCESLILPSNIFPNRKIKVESDTITGFFSVQTCTYIGDTHGNDWTIKIEAE